MMTFLLFPLMSSVITAWAAVTFWTVRWRVPSMSVTMGRSMAGKTERKIQTMHMMLSKALQEESNTFLKKISRIKNDPVKQPWNIQYLWSCWICEYVTTIHYRTKHVQSNTHKYTPAKTTEWPGDIALVSQEYFDPFTRKQVVHQCQPTYRSGERELGRSLLTSRSLRARSNWLLRSGASLLEKEWDLSCSGDACRSLLPPWERPCGEL